jgi:dipeptidyl aminopeptidase/acylaminoacyl peptidase
MRIDRFRLLLLLATVLPAPAGAAAMFEPLDVFELEWASDPRIAPDGGSVVYVRNFMDIMQDRRCSDLWLVAADGRDHRPLTGGNGCHGSPRWSPDGKRLLWVARDDGAQLWMRWMDSGQTAPISRLTRSPDDLAWSPDGRWIAFTMHVPKRAKPMVEPPPKPKGAEWAEPPKVIEKLVYRADGAGYLEDGYRHLFLPAEGATPRQLTAGDFNHGSTPAWSPDGGSLLISANRHEEWEYDPLDSEIYEVSVADGAIRALTDRRGPDSSPAASTDGTRVAYVGFDDRRQGYQVRRLYVMNRDGSGSRVLTGGLDRSVRGTPVWAGDGSGLYFQTSSEGNGKIGFVDLAGKVKMLAADLGGTSLGRPYASGSFTVNAGGRYAYTETRPDHPADVAVGDAADGGGHRVTRLNDDLLVHRDLAEVEETWFDSSFDGRRIQAWVAKPPGFDPAQRYPLILEIHGGPFADYGDRWAAEIQLYAAAGYLVLYVNPRGSTSYGEEFGNLIHHNYPGQDYDDLMSGVDAVIERGWADPEQLYVTGGSGGGVLTAWIVGKTGRFRAAVSAKPVINWYSFSLTSDGYNSYYLYWFPGFPWDRPEAYLERSPLSLVGNVTTPTMLLTGENDLRTPMAESEQYYQALKLRRVATALVRVPGASHGIARRPSQLIAKVQHVLAWFERWAPPQ